VLGMLLDLIAATGPAAKHAAATTTAEPDPWAFGWDALVGIGTLALALGTVGLAAFTYVLARRTRDLARSAEQDSRAQWRPVVLPSAGGADVGPVISGSVGILVIRVRNAGRGPALHVRAQLEHEQAAGGISPERWSLGALAPGDDRALRFRIDGRPFPCAQLLVDYRDLAGRLYSTSITITADGNDMKIYDVRTWEDHQVTRLGDAVYPQPGLRDVAPKR